MESPSKRLKRSPPAFEGDEDFVPLGGDDEEGKATQFGYGTANGSEVDISSAPRRPRAMYQQGGYHTHTRNAWNDPRNAKDRPKSKHTLPGHEPWILVKTKFGRRFVHNTETKESVWHIPQDILPGVREFEQWERQQKEKDANAKWAEDQLKEMRGKSKAGKVNKAADGDARNRRRRSESLQREDEEAMMAELAAEAERGEEKDVKEVVKSVEPLKPVTKQSGGDGGGGGHDSESSYEEIEVTDSEFEDDEEQVQRQSGTNGDAAPEQQREAGPVEFGEDDIAYQLAAMGENYDLDPDEAEVEEWDEEDRNDQALPENDAANLFRDMLDDHSISPFTPWDKLIADESESGIIMDDRYTVLPNMRARKEVWEAWVKDTAARLKEDRARMEKMDPKIPYLAFLADKASTKLYWPEFKRKYRKESSMNDRKVSDKDREKLYRDHVARLKLPESTRKADLVTLLKSVPLAVLNRSTSMDALPQQVLGHSHFISLPREVRDSVIGKHISGLPPAPEEGMQAEDQGLEEDAKREGRRKREKALAERERKVEEERRKAEKEERWAKRDLREEERELRKAMEVGDRDLKAQLRDGN